MSESEGHSDKRRARRGVMSPGRLEALAYDVFYAGALGVLAPSFLYRMAKGKYREGWRHKLGLVPERDAGDRIWIHAVSVGEAVAAATLAEGVRQALPGYEIVVSTTTPTGQEVARKRFGQDRVFYFPLDFSGPVRRAVERTKPSLLVLMELELWPNLIAAATRHGAPVVLVNGRLSERSARGYGRIARFLRPTMRRIAAIGAQTEEYAGRFHALGAPEHRITVTGTLKYDGVRTEPDPEAEEWARRELAISQTDRVLVGGSTHRSEEVALARAWRRVRRQTGGSESKETWRLVIAPRHPPRIGEVEAELAREGFKTVRRTGLGEADKGARGPLDPETVVLVDTVGELGRFYCAADLVFVGGSLIPHGGQNPIEPAGLGKPVLFGPHMFNFAETADALLDEGGARQVESADDLARAVAELASDDAARRALGEAARDAIRSRQGAVARSVELVRNVLAERPVKPQNAPS